MGNTILVTGATGRQGGAVIRHLARNNFKVRALSRTPDSIASRRLTSEGIEVVKGDMADINSLVVAMRGCEGVFSIQNYFEYGAEKEVLFGKNMTEAAAKANVSHLIYSSVCNADAKTGVPHFETKNRIEQHIKKSGVPFTILRPVKFMENYYIPQVFKGILGGKLFDSIRGGKKHPMVALDDIGKYAAQVFTNPVRSLGKTIDIAGDELTNEEVASVMTEVLGSRVKFTRLPLLAVRLLMDRELFLMFNWFDKEGFSARTSETKKDFPSVHPTSLKQFLLDENWQRWNKKGTI